MNDATSPLLQKTKQFALEVIGFLPEIPNSFAGKVIAQQLVRAATSVGSNYRATRRSAPKRNSSLNSDLSSKKSTKVFSGSRSCKSQKLGFLPRSDWPANTRAKSAPWSTALVAPHSPRWKKPETPSLPSANPLVPSPAQALPPAAETAPAAPTAQVTVS
jgi:hypothetical protein